VRDFFTLPAAAMARSTVHWTPGESSLGRESFNNMVRREGKFDVPEAMMRAAAMGRAAELGNGWEPAGIQCRRIADILTKRSCPSSPNLAPFMTTLPSADAAAARSPPLSPSGGPARGTSSRPTSSCAGGDRMQWSSMVPPRDQLAVSAGSGHSPSRVRFAPEPSKTGTTEGHRYNQAGGPVVFPPSNTEGATATALWSAKEASLSRDSFNAIATQTKLDPTEVLMRSTTMSKAAMMGPGWQPSGIVSRNIAKMLTDGP